MLRKILKGIKYLMLFTLGAIALLICYLLISNKTTLTLPIPTGPYTVARVTYDWKDDTRIDSLSPGAKEKREILVWIWYPSKKDSATKSAEYMPEVERKELIKHRGIILSSLLTHAESKVICHSVDGGLVADNQRRYPVIILRSGLGAVATDYTTLAEELASHGYVVIGADAPYSTVLTVFPDGRVITRTREGNPGERAASEEQERLCNNLVRYWSADVKTILDRLTYCSEQDSSSIFWHKLDLEAVGIVGHSFGGAAAAQACHDDPRIKAAIDMDGQPFGTVVSDGMDQPLMILLGDHSHEDSVSAVKAKLHSLYDHTRAPQKLYLTIPSARHFNFSDQCLMKNTIMARSIGAIGPIAPRRDLAVAGNCVRAFFDVHLKHQSNSVFSSMLVQNPEITTSQR